MFKIAVVGDDPLYALELELMLTAIQYDVLIIQNSDADTMMKEIVVASPDLVLTGIFFAGRPLGLLLARELARRNIGYVLYTDQDKPGLFDVAQRLNPYAYLVRPFNEVTLGRSIKLALVNQRNKRNNSLQADLPFSAKSNRGDLVRSDLSQVIAIEAIGNYCYFHLPNQKLVKRSSLVKLTRELPNHLFLRVHRRYMIATRMIKRINLNKREVYIGETVYPIGAKYQKSVSELMAAS